MMMSPWQRSSLKQWQMSFFPERLGSKRTKEGDERRWARNLAKHSDMSTQDARGKGLPQTEGGRTLPPLRREPRPMYTELG